MSDTPRTALLGGEVVVIPSQYSLKDIARFISAVQISPNPIGCWKWGGYINRCGYGTLGVNHGQFQAHRIMHEVYHGEIPDGHHVHHLCGVRDCVNPHHLIAVTPSEHIKDFTPDSFAAVNAAKQFCLRGHPLIAENLRTRHDGHRSCKVCLREDATVKRRTEQASRKPKVKDTCKQGHPWVEDNITTDKYGRRFCTTCRKKIADDWYARKKAGDEPRREKRTTHCKRGHELTDDNVYRWVDKRTHKECWYCRQCSKESARRNPRKKI